MWIFRKKLNSLPWSTVLGRIAKSKVLSSQFWRMEREMFWSKSRANIFQPILKPLLNIAIVERANLQCAFPFQINFSITDTVTWQNSWNVVVNPFSLSWPLKISSSHFFSMWTIYTKQTWNMKIAMVKYNKTLYIWWYKERKRK